MKRRPLVLLLLTALGVLCAAATVFAQGDHGSSASLPWFEVIEEAGRKGAWAVFLMLVFATFVSEDLACITAGLLVANGTVGLPLAVAGCFTGIVVGDSLLYAAGALLGRPALSRAPLRWVVSPGAVQRATAWFARKGPVIIILSRFMPGTRMATYFSAGALHTGFGRFLLFFCIAAALWTPAVVYLASLAGRKVLAYYHVWEDFAVPLALALLLAMYLLLHYILPLATWRGRRLLLSKWRRATRWEFWPLWQFNGPLLAYVLYLGFIRYRRPTLFTVVNPGIPHSGFCGESKSDILHALAGAGEAVATWTLLPHGVTVDDNLATLSAWMAEHQLDYPIVLKPDTGERGLAVKVIRSRDAARAYLEQACGPVIAQRYVGGVEYGVFYYRFPGEACGHVPSVTHKVLTAVVGDGVRDLETLILADDRAVCLAPVFLERMGVRCFEVPALGERVPLVEVGTHARGATFLDAGHLITPELTRRIDEIAKAFDGFYFGRFDIRTDSEESLKAGRNLTVLELNGLTAEATHMYDPAYRVTHAWAIQMRQWRTAFEIARMNAERGHEPWRTWRFLKHWYHATGRRRRMAARE